MSNFDFRFHSSRKQRERRRKRTRRRVELTLPSFFRLLSLLNPFLSFPTLARFARTQEMSLLLKYSYFPPNQPPPHAIAPDGKVISAGDEDKDTGTPIMESRSWPGMLQIGHSRENKHKR